MKEYKKLLIISHNCLSKTGSNGRTLANYLQGWPKDKIAQFYIHSEVPDFEICEQYYCMTDSSIVKSILKRTPAGYKVKKDIIQRSTSYATATSVKAKNKNSIIFFLREIAWKSKFWNGHDFFEWLGSVVPEVILVQAGDAGFLLELAVDVGERFGVPIIVYNTEGYYFKNNSYLSENWLSKFFYSGLNRRFKKSYEKLVRASKVEIYNCDLLKNDYEKVFHTTSHVIMNTSEFTEEEVFYPKKNQIIYAGNLGLFRHKSLIEFANALKNVRPDMVIDVYGKVPNEDVKKEIEKCDGIKMHGFISYEELKQKLRESKYLLHVESFESFYREDLKYAFSTKIADSLAAGACLFIYAPENMAISQYLNDKNAAELITEKSHLETQIRNVLMNFEISDTYAKNGRELALKNHNISINKNIFQMLLNSKEE